MKKPQTTIAGAVYRLIEGDPLPSFKSDELAALSVAMSEILTQPREQVRHDLEDLGNQVLGILNRRMKASAGAEKVVAQIRGDLRPLQ